VWTDLCDADSEDLAALAQELTLNPLAVEDAVGHAARAKATRYPTHTFVTAQAVTTSGNEDPPSLCRCRCRCRWWWSGKDRRGECGGRTDRCGRRCKSGLKS